MFEDIYSRKIFAHLFHQNDTDEQAALVERGAWAEKISKNNVVLHSDICTLMKSLTMRARIYDFGAVASRIRHRISNDITYLVARFRTAKYHPRWPREVFKSLDDTIQVKEFVDWYNNEHRYSRINFVTPSQRLDYLDVEILAKRKVLHQTKRNEYPQQ